MMDDLTPPDPLYFQQASMLLLVFRFRGRRKLVASRLMESSDFPAELAAHAPILDRHYGELEVSAVDVVSYQHGRFYTDPWPDGAAWLARLRERPAASADSSDPGSDDPDTNDAEEADANGRDVQAGDARTGDADSDRAVVGEAMEVPAG